MDKDYKLLPLTFERGIQEFYQPSMLPIGALPQLRNWEPMPSGELRPRVPWVKGSTTSAPSTRKNVGTGYFSRTITPGIVQQSVVAYGDSGGGTTVDLAPSWPTSTTKGNLLILLIGGGPGPYLGNPTLPTPSGWTEAVDSTGSSTRPEAKICYIANAASQTGAVSFQVSNMANNSGAAAQLIEVSGITPSSPLDKTSSGAGDTNPATSGATSTTAQASEFCIGLLCSTGAEGFTSIGDGFSLVSFQNTGGSSADQGFGSFYRTTTATGARTCSATGTSGTYYGGALATFKGWYTSTPTTDSETRLLAAQNDTSEYDIFSIPRTDIAAGTWSNLGSVTASDPTKIVAFAPGLGRVWLTNTQFTGTYYYDGVSLSAVSDSPAGKCIAVHKNRVWVAGTNASPGRLWYSDINDGTTWPTANFIDVLREGGEAIEDITPMEDALIIGTRTGLWQLSGSGPDSFVLRRLPMGGLAPGRTIMPTPYGAVCAGRKHIWLVANGQVSLISRPISSSYGLTGSYLSSSYANDIYSVLDATSGTIWSLNMQTGVWWEERVDTAAERPNTLHNHDDMQLMGPAAATVGSLLNYRLLPGTSRGKDFNTLPETFSARTPEIWPVGPEFHITPRHLFLKVRQLGGNDSQTGLTVTPYYNGVAGTAKTFGPQPTSGVYRWRFDLGEKKGVNYVQFYFDQVMGASEAAAFEIEEATLGFYVEEIR